MRHARNRFLFFLLFGTYSFLSVLGTTDIMLFMESPIEMLLLNIKLPLLSFYTLMPVFLLALHFNLLYTFHSYRKFLIKTKIGHPLAIESLPIGLYEGAILKRGNFHRFVRFIMHLLLYIFPVIVLTAFWFRFSDYQDSAITSWHFLAIIISMMSGFYFRGLMYLDKRKVCFSSSLMVIVSLIFIVIIVSYSYFIIFPITRNKVDVSQLEYLLEFQNKINQISFFKHKEWFLPQIVIRNEVLVPNIHINKNYLEVLQEVDNKKINKPLLYSYPEQNRQKRSFRLANLSGCTFPNTNFHEAEFQWADLSRTKLLGADLSDANLLGADLTDAEFQGADLNHVKLQGNNLINTQFRETILNEEQRKIINSSIGRNSDDKKHVEPSKPSSNSIMPNSETGKIIAEGLTDDEARKRVGLPQLEKNQ